MKSPLWILNSALAAVLLGLALIIAIMRPQRPARTSLNPNGMGAPLQEAMPQLDPSQIYKHDLFATYSEIKQVTPEVPVKRTVVPQPPAPKVTPLTTPQSVQFLPPLAITIKGIMYSHKESENRAIIADVKTKKESLHKIGDNVLDAEIIYIGNNKVMFLRSNGQQETLFVTQQDADKDPLYHPRTGWDAIAKKINDTEYIVYQDQWQERVENVAQGIEMLDLTTAFHKGKILGCRIGRGAELPLLHALGLLPGDIIIAINDIPTTTTQKRVAIYSALKTIDNDQDMKVTILRNGSLLTLQYVIHVNSQEPKVVKKERATPPREKQNSHQQEQQPVRHDEHIKEYATTTQNIQKRDKTAMFNFGGKNALLDTMQQ